MFRVHLHCVGHALVAPSTKLQYCLNLVKWCVRASYGIELNWIKIQFFRVQNFAWHSFSHTKLIASRKLLKQIWNLLMTSRKLLKQNWNLKLLQKFFVSNKICLSANLPETKKSKSCTQRNLASTKIISSSTWNKHMSSTKNLRKRHLTQTVNSLWISRNQFKATEKPKRDWTEMPKRDWTEKPSPGGGGGSGDGVYIRLRPSWLIRLMEPYSRETLTLFGCIGADTSDFLLHDGCEWYLIKPVNSKEPFFCLL